MSAICCAGKLLRRLVVVWGLLLVLCGCVKESSKPLSDKAANEEMSQQLVEKAAKSYESGVCESRFLESFNYVCPKGQGGTRSEIWKKFFPMGSRCIAYTPSNISMDPSNNTAKVESFIEQQVRPPVGSGAELHRWMTVRDTWKEVGGKWCIEGGEIIEISLTPPDNKSVSTAN